MHLPRTEDVTLGKSFNCLVLDIFICETNILTEFSVASSAPPRSVAFVIKLLFQIGIKVNFSVSENTYGEGR